MEPSFLKENTYSQQNVSTIRWESHDSLDPILQLYKGSQPTHLDIHASLRSRNLLVVLWRCFHRYIIVTVRLVKKKLEELKAQISHRLFSLQLAFFWNPWYHNRNTLFPFILLYPLPVPLAIWMTLERSPHQIFVVVLCRWKSETQYVACLVTHDQQLLGLP